MGQSLVRELEQALASGGANMHLGWTAFDIATSRNVISAGCRACSGINAAASPLDQHLDKQLSELQQCCLTLAPSDI